MSFISDNKYLFFTLLLALLLVIPWGLSVLSPGLEPYPAVIMPSGEGTISLVGDRLTYTRRAVWARQPERGWERLEVSDFLNPIPRQYFYAIRENRFGTTLRDRDVIGVRLLPDFSVKRNKVTLAETDEARNWLAEKLQALGYDSEGFEVRTEVLHVSRSSGRIIEREVTNVEVYSLR